jgi:hypothetical protein
MLRKRFALVATLGLTLLLGCSSVAWAQSVGAADSFAIEASAGVTAAGGAGTVVAGNVGSSPNMSITGFPPAVVAPGFGIHANTAAAIAAQAASVQLFTDLNAGACTTNAGAEMSGANFGPGIHCFPSTANLAASSTMTISGAGIHIFRVTSALTANVSSTVLFAGADPCLVFWQVGSAATLNGVNFGGNVVSQAGVTLGVGAALTGRALANAGPVTLAGTNTVGGCSTPSVPPPCPTISLSPATLPNGTVGVAYTQTISASGGTAPYGFAVTTGTLPAGLTLTPAGVLFGTPTAAGTSSFTITASDANSCAGSLAYTITIAAAAPVPPVCPAITISPVVLPNGTVGVAYNQTFGGSGGTAPYAFGVTLGTLPAGLVLTSAGVLSGTPLTAGTSTFTVRATDANGCFAERAFSIIVDAAPIPVPTMNEWALIMLAAVLAFVGLTAIRRRTA